MRKKAVLLKLQQSVCAPLFNNRLFNDSRFSYCAMFFALLKKSAFPKESRFRSDTYVYGKEDTVLRLFIGITYDQSDVPLMWL